jgi:Family of unknown function (DUF5412)
MRTLLAILLVLAILSVIFLVSFDMSLCGNQLIEDVKSPNGKYAASVFERNCGATTPYIEIVSLNSSVAKFDPENYNNWVFTIHGGSKVKAAWISDDKLKVSYTFTGDALAQQEKWNGINITFKLTAR